MCALAIPFLCTHAPFLPASFFLLPFVRPLQMMMYEGPFVLPPHTHAHMESHTHTHFPPPRSFRLKNERQTGRKEGRKNLSLLSFFSPFLDPESKQMRLFFLKLYSRSTSAAVVVPGLNPVRGQCAENEPPPPFPSLKPPPPLSPVLWPENCRVL